MVNHYGMVALMVMTKMVNLGILGDAETHDIRWIFSALRSLQVMIPPPNA